MQSEITTSEHDHIHQVEHENDGAGSIDWWKYTATAACTAVAVMATAYFTGAKDWVTQDEVVKIIQSQGPYVTERSRIDKELSTFSARLEKLDSTMDELTKAVIRLQVYLEKQNADTK